MFAKKFLAFLEPSEQRRFWKVLGLLLLSSFCESLGLALVLPYIFFLQDPSVALTYPLISSLTAYGASPHVLIFAVTSLFLVILLLKACLQLWVQYEIAAFPYAVFHHHSQKLFRSYLEMPYLSFTTRNSNLLLKNCAVTTDQMAYALMAYLQYLSACILTLFLACVLLLEEPVISSVLMALFGSLATVVYLVFHKSQKQAGIMREKALGELYKAASEAFQSIREIRLYEKVPYFLRQYGIYSEQIASNTRISCFYPQVPAVVIESVAMVLLLLLVLFLTATGYPLAVLVPQLIFFGLIGRRLLPALNQIVSQRILLQRLDASLSILEQEPTPPPQPSSKKERFEKSIEFRGVSFAYSPEKPVLHSIDLVLRKNQSTALVGPSGAGKSTIIELLTSLLSPSTGAFFLDDQPVGDLKGIKQQIGYVPQLIHLLDETIEKNICFGEEQPDPVRIQKAVQMAHLADFISTLPQGLQTVVGERGVKLSGGQRQRLGIARALYQQPDLLIFDEATASLDQIAESAIAEQVNTLAGSKTIVAIAHRMRTIQNFDQIYVLDEGRIVASGTHAELLKSCSLYQRMGHAQA